MAKDTSSNAILSGLRVVTESGNLHSEHLPASRVMLYAGDRSRSGSLTTEPHPYEIERRDLRVRYRIDPARRTYQAIPLFQMLTPEESAKFVRSGEAWRKHRSHVHQEPSREYRVTTHSEKLPQTREFFGCVAYRWETTSRSTRETPFGESWSESVTHAWYLDSDQLQSLYPGFHPALVPSGFVLAMMGDERLVRETTGERPTGLCADSTVETVTHAPGANDREMERRSTSFHRITSLTAEEFEAWLFDRPYGYRKVSLYPNRLQLAMYDVKRSWDHLRWRLNQSA